MASFEDLSNHLDMLKRKAAPLTREVATVVAPVLALNVQTVMGDNSKLQDLADSTQAERAALGFTPNDPLVRTGGLRDQVMPVIVGADGVEAAAAVSDDPIAGYQEFGTATIPARAAFERGMLETEGVAKAVSLNLMVRILES